MTSDAGSAADDDQDDDQSGPQDPVGDQSGEANAGAGDDSEEEDRTPSPLPRRSTRSHPAPLFLLSVAPGFLLRRLLTSPFRTRCW
jgi:hypothetical protein